MTLKRIEQLRDEELPKHSLGFTRALSALWLLLYKGERDKQAVKETLLKRIEEQRKFLDELENEIKEL
ncbi:MAG TPA: hypothetical protein VFA10_17980 [Ktedonobacteraceae bacterium]|nr:hypothetical protein [Ktedonobacteraceae bacterium]